MSVFGVIKRNPVVFPLACLAVVALVVVSEVSYWRSKATLATLSETATARDTVQDLHRGILDAETGQRGFLLTGREDYLHPYERGVQQITASLKYLDRRAAKDPDATALLAKLHTAVDAKLSELSETMRLQREGKNDAALALMLSDIGRERMDKVRQLTTEVVARESAKEAADQAGLVRTLRLERLGVLLLSALSLVSLFMYLRQASALDDERRQQQIDEESRRDRLETEVAQRTAQLAELATHLQTAREDERHRLARNLHDELGALLTSAKLDAARIRSRLAAGGPPEALERLHHLVDTLNSSIALGRRIIEDLRPSTLGNLGLVPTLEILARDFSTHSGTPVHCTLQPVKLGPEAQLAVYRLVQEAITNITKYARAQQVWIELGPADGKARIRVRDDGAGFDPATIPRSAYGLLGMRHRVASQGGSFRLSSSPGQGTTIEVTLPEMAPAPSPIDPPAASPGADAAAAHPARNAAADR